MVIETRRLRAAAGIKGEGGIWGSVRFYETLRGILVVADIQGLPENDSGFYGFHIHEGSGCGGKAFADTKGHYNPAGAPHPRHAGDLSALLADQGRAFLAVETGRLQIPQILGRTVVIHDGPDDFRTQPAGASGRKIACGVLQAQ